MTSPDRLTVFHAPQTRSTGMMVLLDELGADYDLRLLNMKAGEQRQPAYLAINPMGKVPALRRGGEIVTEQGAVYLYLADLFPKAGLAPALDDPLRGPYLRWIVFYGSSFEPAVVDRAVGREAPPQSMSPYGNFDHVMDAVSAQLGKGPYMLGERFSAADVLWGSALAWTMMFKIVPERPEFTAYVRRVTARPSFGRINARDAAWAAEHAAAAAAG